MGSLSAWTSVNGRQGFTAVEALVALLLTSLLLQAAWSVASGMARASTRLADRAEGLAALRVTAWVLQEETAGARAGVDVSEPRGDSIAIRAFRGTAFVCGVPSPGAVVVRWSGIRAPDPVKDSVLVLNGDGRWSATALEGRAGTPGACPVRGGGVEERWTLADSVPGAVLLRLFERGSYHLSDGLLRYRIGQGGRQPLTPPQLDPDRSALVALGPGSLVVRATARGRFGDRWLGWERVLLLESP